MEKKGKSKGSLDSMQLVSFRERKQRMPYSSFRQMQEKYLAKKKELWMAFVDLEKAFDRVPRVVV